MAQNLALPFALDIDPVPPETLARVDALADECEIARAHLSLRAGDVRPAVRSRVHLARAIALGPRLLLMEHPTAALEGTERKAYGAIVARVCDSRALTMLAVTQDLEFASAAAHDTLTLAGRDRAAVAARRSVVAVESLKGYRLSMFPYMLKRANVLTARSSVQLRALAREA